MKRLNYTLTRMLILLLGCFSLSLSFSCSGDVEVDMPMESLPSTPTAVYIIKGKVISGEDGDKGLAGIQIGVSIENQTYADTLYTENDGEFKWEASLSTFEGSLHVKLSVVDTCNIYESTEATVSFDNDEAGLQFLGEVEKDIRIRLKEKN